MFAPRVKSGRRSQPHRHAQCAIRPLRPAQAPTLPGFLGAPQGRSFLSRERGPLFQRWPWPHDPLSQRAAAPGTDVTADQSDPATPHSRGSSGSQLAMGPIPREIAKPFQVPGESNRFSISKLCVPILPIGRRSCWCGGSALGSGLPTLCLPGPGQRPAIERSPLR